MTGKVLATRKRDSNGLTVAEEAFCQAYLRSGSIKDAVEVSGVRSPNPLTTRVKARVQELRDQLQERTAAGLEEHLNQLAEIRDLAKGQKQFNAAITAEVARGKVLGFYVHRVEHTGKGGGAIEMAVTPDLSHLSESDLLAYLELNTKVMEAELVEETNGELGTLGCALQEETPHE